VIFFTSFQDDSLNPFGDTVLDVPPTLLESA
jgi:hypothetical protein